MSSDNVNAIAAIEKPVPSNIQNSFFTAVLLFIEFDSCVFR